MSKNRTGTRKLGTRKLGTRKLGTRKLGSRKNKKSKRKTLRKNIRGGIRIENNYNEISALKYFLQHARFSILGHSSASCIPLLATLQNTPEIISQSPYRHTRTNFIDKPVTQLIFKIFLWGEKPGIIDDPQLRADGIIQLTTQEMMQREIRIQEDIFLKTMLNNTTLLEPSCPGIVFATKSKLTSKNKQIVLNRIKTQLDGTDPFDSMCIQRLLSYEVSFVAMEFMDGFRPLQEFRRDPLFEDYKLMAFYELDKIHRAGYLHNDFHFENVMIRPDYRYFTLSADPNEQKYLGRAIFIDFGLSEPIPSNFDLTDDKTRIQLLKREYGDFSQLNKLLETFRVFDAKHIVVQTKYIRYIENLYNDSIQNIINSYKLYKYIGGKLLRMSSVDSALEHLEPSLEPALESSKDEKFATLDEWLASRPPRKPRRDVEPIDFSKLEQDEIREFEAELENDPEYHKDFIKSVKALKPGDLEEIIKSAMRGPYWVDGDFDLGEFDD